MLKTKPARFVVPVKFFVPLIVTVLVKFAVPEYVLLPDKVKFDAGLKTALFNATTASTISVADAIVPDASVTLTISPTSALKELNKIIGACDGIMVARGDLGVELPPEEVPGIQKDIILKCRQAGKPVIVATQMLESMIESPSPTRAEASDVATAVFDGADAVMLSAETAIGSFPIETVNIMDRIIFSAENHIKMHPGDGPQNLKVENYVYNAVSRSAVSLAEAVNAKAVVAFTASGNTAFRMARERPNLLLVVMTPEVKVKRKLSLLWGAYSFFSKVQGYEAAIKEAREIIKIEKLAKKGDAIVVVAGMPFGVSGSTNSIRVVDI